LALKLHNTIPEGNTDVYSAKFRKTSFGNSVLSTKLFDQLINPSRSMYNIFGDRAENKTP